MQSGLVGAPTTYGALVDPNRGAYKIALTVGVIVGETMLIAVAMRDRQEKTAIISDDVKDGSLASSDELVGVLDDMIKISIDKKSRECLEYARNIVTHFRSSKRARYYMKKD